jgi:hypothetical protein
MVPAIQATNLLNKLLLTRSGVTEQVLGVENGKQALHLLDQTCRALATSACGFACNR